MAKNEYSKYQQDLIGRYYKNLDAIMLGKLQELVTELYLAKDGPKEDKLWERANKTMVKMKVHPTLIEHIMLKRNVEVLANNLQDWLKKTKK